jgi:hypothetical protein
MDGRLGWQELGSTYLYHGTTQDRLSGILREGIRGPSWWGTERVAEYYSEDREASRNDDELVDLDYIEEPPAEPLVVRVPLSRFDKGSLAADENSIAEPLTNVLGRDEERLYHQWMLSRRTWQDCLRIYESVWYNAPMEVTEADIL